MRSQKERSGCPWLSVLYESSEDQKRGCARLWGWPLPHPGEPVAPGAAWPTHHGSLRWAGRTGLWGRLLGLWGLLRRGLWGRRLCILLLWWGRVGALRRLGRWHLWHLWCRLERWGLLQLVGCVMRHLLFSL